MNTQTTNNGFWNKDFTVDLLLNRTTSPPKKGKLGVLSALLLIVLFTTCEEKDVTFSTESQLTQLTLNIAGEALTGTIDQQTKRVTFDAGKLTAEPTQAEITVITLSKGATATHDTNNKILSLSGGKAQIIVTAEDKKTKSTYTVEVTYQLLSKTEITAITLAFDNILQEPVEGNINNTARSTTFDLGRVPSGTVFSKATITVLTLSEGATADHDTGDSNQLAFENNRAIITLTSSDGTTEVPYIVTLEYTIMAAITAIKVQFGENNVTGIIEGTTVKLDIGAVGDGNPLPVVGVITKLTLSEGASSAQGLASDGKQDELKFANGAAQIEVSSGAEDTQTYTIQIEYSVTGNLGQLVLQVETTDYLVSFENNSGTIVLKGGTQIPATATVSNVILGEGVSGLTTGSTLSVNEDQVTFTLTDGEGAEHVYTVQLLLIDRYHIADVGFLAYLKEVLPSDAFVAEDTLLVSHTSVQTLTSITATNRSISSLDGIQFFTKITVLNCSNNSIESLDLSQNTALNTLNCSNNSIQSLDLSQNTALNTLNCSSNSIQSLDLSSHVALTNLNCASNLVLSSLILPPQTAERTATWNELLCNNNILTTLNLQGVRNADVSMNLFAVNTNYDNYTTLRVNTALQNHNAMASVKDGRQEELTISTYDSDNSLVCSDYDPREATRGCKDNQPLRSLTLTIATEDYLATFDENNKAKITLPENTPIPLTTTVKAVSLRSGASGPAIGSMLSIIGDSISLQATPSTGESVVTYTITIEGGFIPQFLTFGFNEADNNDGDDNTADALATLKGGAQYAGTVNQEARTVAVVVDAYARTFDISQLSAYFTLSVGASATVENVAQTTGVTTNNFSSTVTYRIAFAGSAPIDYTVTVRKTNTAPIPNENFRAVLQTVLPLEAFQQDSLVTDHASVTTLQNIYVENHFISSIKGIEFFTGLTTLDCSDNHIDYMNLSQNTALITLTCHSNRLSALDLSLNTALTTLDCSTNSLAVLNLTSNIALIELDCSVNELNALSLASNTALAILNCFRNNNLSSLTLPERTSERTTPWTYVNCSYNSLTSLDLQMVQNADADITIYSNQPSQDQLTSLQVHTALQNHPDVRHLKDRRDDAVVISTYNDSGQLVCVDYNPLRRDCNDAMPLRTLTLTIAGADYPLSFTTSTQAEIILPTGTSTPATATVQEVTLRSQAQGLSIGDDLTITAGSITLTITPATGDNDITYTIVVRDGLTPRLLTFGFFEADNSDQDASTQDALTTQAGGANYAGIINQETKTVTVAVDAYAKSFDNTRLKAYFTSSSGTTTTIEGVVQATGTTANDFSSAITYRVAFDDGSAATEYTATVMRTNIAPIPDRNFRKILQVAIPNAFQQDNLVIDHVSVTSLQSISVENNFTSSLQGIEFFTGLTILNCNENNINYMDLSQNTALTTLKCKFSQVPPLNLSQNTNLKVLDCSFSNITSLDLSLNTALTTLNCSSTDLTALDLTNNVALTTLNCQGNEIAVLDLSQNTALRALDCRLNTLMALDLSQNTTLSTLDCGLNKLTTLDLSLNAALTVLKCDNNPNLSSLTLSSQATALSSVVSGFCSLTSLNLQMVRNAGATIQIYSGNSNRDQFTTLQVNTALQNNIAMVAVKNGRGDAVTISTYDNNNQLVCANYDPRSAPNNSGMPVGCP